MVWGLSALLGARRSADDRDMAATGKVVRCDRCGALVEVGRSDLPLTYVTRQDVAADRPTFLMVGEHHEQSVLLHACTDRTWRPWTRTVRCSQDASVTGRAFDSNLATVSWGRVDRVGMLAGTAHRRMCRTAGVRRWRSRGVDRVVALQSPSTGAGRSRETRRTRCAKRWKCAASRGCSRRSPPQNCSAFRRRRARACVLVRWPTAIHTGSAVRHESDRRSASFENPTRFRRCVRTNRRSWPTLPTPHRWRGVFLTAYAGGSPSGGWDGDEDMKAVYRRRAPMLVTPRSG